MRFYGESNSTSLIVDDLTEEHVDEEHRRATITPACELYFRKLKAKFPGGLYSFAAIAAHTETMGHSYLAAVQWMRMLWKAGRVRRYYRGEYVRGRDGHSGSKWGVHYEW